MNIILHKNPEEEMLLELNAFIHDDRSDFEYHMNHIKLTKTYAMLINEKLGRPVSNRKLSYIALAHDILKEKGLDNKSDDKTWRGYTIPQDLVKYVRSNLDILEIFNLDDYFNTSANWHPLSAGIFLYSEFGIKDIEILYPVMFHSCPIISVYKELSKRVRTMVDIIMLSDKLSSNYLRINMEEKEVKLDLDLAVFGESSKEFNYSLGLVLSRLIAQGKSDEKQSKIATDYYYQRLLNTNPLMPKNYKKLGGNKKWPKRKNPLLKMR